MRTGGGQHAEIHVLIEDLSRALSPLAAGRASGRGLGDPGVNINLVYLATNTRLVFAADDFATAGSAHAVASARRWRRMTKLGACGMWCGSRR